MVDRLLVLNCCWMPGEALNAIKREINGAGKERLADVLA
jgi:hypothetical protein